MLDAIILGAAGALGSSAAFHLAARGARILGLDQFAITGHDRGSSHGHSRIIRMCYYEHPDYVPLLRRSYTLWHDLERRAGAVPGNLLRITGALYMGPHGCEAVEGAARAAVSHHLDHQRLTHADIAARFPQFYLPDDFSGLHEPLAGILRPERIIAAHIRLAAEAGADLRGNHRATDWHSDGDTVTIHTDRGTHRAKHLIITAGAWASRVIRDMGVDITATRQVLGWVRPRDPANLAPFHPDRFPIWAIDAAHLGEGLYYGFPHAPEPGEPDGLKLAHHHATAPVDPDTADRSPHPEDESSFRPALTRWLPDLDGPTSAMRICLYENSPDGHFIIDRHPRHPNVTIAAGFSGHGFKFASVTGEILADLALQGITEHPIGFLSLRRWKTQDLGLRT